MKDVFAALTVEEFRPLPPIEVRERMIQFNGPEKY
jgi:hypothetical protein